jgi:hypothetical protein
MSTVQIRTSTRAPRRSAPRSVLRWMATFLGFPLGGVIPWLVLGPVDSLGPALAGGLVTGGILGTVQAWGLGRSRRFTTRWTAATAGGLTIGLGVGAASVDYDTTLTALVIQGAVCGLAVGIAQGLVLRLQLGALALAWPPFLAGAWAVGWAVTTAAGIGVDEQFTVFGSSGALVVALLTSALPLALRRSDASTS